MESRFVYGTLQDAQVQARVFGRIVQGEPDMLDGFRKAEINGTVYPIAVIDSAHVVSGQVIEVTAEELVRIDRYEGAEYRRIPIRLRTETSKLALTQAWVERVAQAVADEVHA
jgi:gamma-glutamylcyclotransferase (GGCT)/AIG2-like uncharacterized protein YtfP